MGTIMNYSIEKKTLAATRGDIFTGRIHHNQVLGMESLIDIMAHKNTTITRQDIIGVMDLFNEVVLDNIAKGNMISTPLFRTGFSLKGEFSSLSDKIDYRKHKMRLSIRLASGLSEKMTRGMQLRRRRRSGTGFGLSHIEKFGGEETSRVFCGDVIEVHGRSLKVYHCKADYEVLFVKTGKVTAASRVIRLSNARAVTTVPENLQPGEYDIIFVKRFNGNERRAEGPVLQVE